MTTHVLDTAHGRPASGVVVRLESLSEARATRLAESTTNSDGRISELGPDRLEPGEYRLTFATGDYFDRLGVAFLHPRVEITFRIADPEQHYHVPLLLSPFSYSTYRGS